jgi:hypothetical protein
MAAGLVMAIANATLKTALDLDPEPSHVLKLLNRTLFRTGTRRTFMTVFYALLTPATGELVTINAGHPFPLLRRADGRLEELGQGCLPLGVRPELAPAPQVTNLAPGDLLLLYTDGLAEAVNRHAEAFGFSRIEALAAAGGTPQVLHDRILAAFDAHVEQEPLRDDLTLLVMARDPSSAGAVPALPGLGAANQTVPALGATSQAVAVAAAGLGTAPAAGAATPGAASAAAGAAPASEAPLTAAAKVAALARAIREGAMPTEPPLAEPAMGAKPGPPDAPEPPGGERSS